MGYWVFVVLLGLVALGVDGYPAEDLILRLPGQPKVGFRQFAGYVNVDEKRGRSLFYYFAEAEEHPEKKPLTIWMNGGPGCASVGGAFTGLGPFLPKGDGRGVRKNKSSWSKASNLLFVDSPAGVGWSYSNTTSDYNTGDASTANDMYVFLLRWYEKFPEFKSRDLFLAGESYAGHFIPPLAIVLLNHNKHSTGLKFNIKGIAVETYLAFHSNTALGNPLLKIIRDIPSIYLYFWSHGLISDEIGLAIKNHCDFDVFTFTSPHNVTNECNNAIDEANSVVGNYIGNYDVIVDVCYPAIAQKQLQLGKSATKISLGIDVCLNDEKVFYFNLPEVQHAFHANRTSLPYSWVACRTDVLNYSSTDPDTNILPLVKTIVQNGIPFWLFSGDQDSIVPLTGSRTIIRELAQDLKFKVTVPYGAWFYKGQVGGWATEYGNLLTFATVRGGGHFVAFTQPERALLLFQSFVSGKRLPNTTYPPIV